MGHDVHHAGSKEAGRPRLLRQHRVVAMETPVEGLRRRTLVLTAVTISILGIVYVVTYWLLDQHVAAAIPFTYQVVSVINLAMLAKARRYRLFRRSQLALSLMLPFLLHISLGGFAVQAVSSSGPSRLRSEPCCSPVAGRLSRGPPRSSLSSSRRARSIAPLRMQAPGSLPPSGTVFFVSNIGGVTGTCYILLHYFAGERDAMLTSSR